MEQVSIFHLLFFEDFFGISGVQRSECNVFHYAVQATSVRDRTDSISKQKQKSLHW